MSGDDSRFIRHVPCPKCGSSDANSYYSDGHTHCFACGHHTKGSGEARPSSDNKTYRMADFLKIEVGGIPSRKITEETAEKFGYGVAAWKGKKVQVAPYYDADGKLVAQHIRTRDKSFPWIGSPNLALPFGATRFPRSGKMIVVTEGEIDALSMSQVTGNKWPVVSIGCGAGAQTRKYIAQHRAYFQNFEKVVLMFDMDEPGRTAAREAAEVIGRSAHIADLPLKDANEMLKAGRVEELVNAMWRATPHRPDGMVEAKSLKDKVLEGPQAGLSYPWPTITKLTYGIRTGELIAIGGGTGSGKTTWLLELTKHLAGHHQKAVGCFFLEQPPVETATRLAGLIGKTKFHVRGEWTEDDLAKAWEKFEGLAPIHLYDSFGATSYEDVEERIRFLAEVEGVKYFILDHLTALVAAAEDDERTALEGIMASLAALVKELDICIWFVSHLTTPDGTPHEEGGRVFLRHLRGSRAIGYWSHFAWGLERNQQAEDLDERHTIAFRCLKDRKTGQANGEVVYLKHAGTHDQLTEVTAFVPEIDGDTTPAGGDTDDNQDY